MKVLKKDIIFYSEWYSDLYPEDEEIFWWLDKGNGEFFDSDELIDDFDYEDNDDIQKSGNFIKLPFADCLDLIKDYIEEKNLSSLKSKIQQITTNKNKCFTVAFRIAIEAAGDIEDNWYSYFESKLDAIADQWAEENNISFYVPFDSDLKVDLEELKANCVMEFDDDIKTGVWLDKSDYHIIQSNNSDENYIGIERIDEKDIIKSFIKMTYPDKTDSEITDLINDADSFYDFLEENDADEEYEEYKDLKVSEYAISWCKSNNILYFVKSGEPSKRKAGDG